MRAAREDGTIGLMGEIDRRMDQERARIERRQRHRDAYDDWRGSWPWRWLPAGLRRRLWPVRVQVLGLPPTEG